MSSSKIERALHGPSWTEVFFGAVLSAVLGLGLAVTYLVFKPVLGVRELPKEPVPNQVYFVEGSTQSREGAWLHKRQMLCDGQSVELSEEELNTALVVSTEKPQVQPPKKAGQEASLAPGQLNFRVDEGELQMALPVNISMLNTSLLLQAKGGFTRSGEGFRYTPHSVFLGSLPAHRVPGLSAFLIKRLASSKQLPDDLSAAWSKLQSVTIEGRALRLGF